MLLTFALLPLFFLAATLPAATAMKPMWAWDTVGSMAFTHTCNETGPWSDEALDVLAKFPLVTVERFMGQYASCPPGNRTWAHGVPVGCAAEEGPSGLTPTATGRYVEDHAIAALAQIKARSRGKTATIFYHDSGRMWTNDQPSGMGRVPPQPSRYWNPTVYRFDDEIIKAHPEYCLHNRSGGFAYDSYANNHVYDHSRPGVPEAWASLCLNVTRSGVADGCFADYASMGGDDPAAPGQPASHGVQGVMSAWQVDKEVAQLWVNGHQKALDLLMAGLNKLSGGGGVLVANGGRNKHTNGFMMETFQPSTGDIRVIQGAAKDGVFNQVHCNMYAGAGNPDTRDCLAAFLIGTGPNAYFSGPDSWNVRQSAQDPAGIEDVRARWRPEYDKPLGPPSGLGALAGDTWHRDFAHASVDFNTTICKGTIRWADGSVTDGPGCDPGCKTCHKVA